MGLLLKFYDPVLAEQTGSKNWIRFGGTTFQTIGIDEDCVYFDVGLYSDHA